MMLASLCSVYYASGTSIAQFPSAGLVLTEHLKDQGHEVVTGESVTRRDVPILGMFDPDREEGGGRVVLYGDSNCFDNSHMQKGEKRNMNASLLESLYSYSPLRNWFVSS